MSAKTQNAKRGFTLTEMMVAVALAVIILLVVVTAFTQASGVTTLSHANTEAVHNAKVAMSLLEKDLESAFLDPTGQRFYSYNRGSLGIVLEFLTSSDLGTIDGGSYVRPAGTHVVYYVDDTTGIRRLIRWSEPYVDPAGASLNPGLPLAGQDNYEIAWGIESFQARFFHDGTWYDPASGDHWNSADPYGADGTDDEPPAAPSPGLGGDDVQYRRLPQVVEVTLEVTDADGVLGKEQNNPVTLRRLMDLPETE